MSSSDARIELRCPDCDWVEACDLAKMRARLVEIGTLKRATDPEPALVEELFRSSAAKMACPDCGSALTCGRTITDDDEDWGDARNCEACNRPIARERLDALPNATRCAACQGKLDRGEPAGEAEYCPYCGSHMVLRQTTGRSAGYVMRCGECGK